MAKNYDNWANNLIGKALGKFNNGRNWIRYSFIKKGSGPNDQPKVCALGALGLRYASDVQAGGPKALAVCKLAETISARKYDHTIDYDVRDAARAVYNYNDTRANSFKDIDKVFRKALKK